MTADVNVVIDHSEYTILVVDDVVSNVLLLKVLLTNCLLYTSDAADD